MRIKEFSPEIHILNTSATMPRLAMTKKMFELSGEILYDSVVQAILGFQTLTETEIH